MLINSQQPKRKRKKKNSEEKRFQKIINDNRDLIKTRKKALMSAGEFQISQILDNNRIYYKREFYIKGLYNPRTNKPLFLDFFIPDCKVAIEFNGPQHYRPVYGNEALIQQQLRDAIKYNYCRKNGIKLLRISYFTKDIELTICQFFDKHFPV